MSIPSTRLTLLIEIETDHIDMALQASALRSCSCLHFSFPPALFHSLCPPPHLLPPSPPSSLPPSRHLSPLAPRPPPTIVSRARRPSIGSFPELSLYAFRELLKLPSSAVLLGTLHGLTPAGLLVLRRRPPPFSPFRSDPRALPLPLLPLALCYPKYQVSPFFFLDS